MRRFALLAGLLLSLATLGCVPQPAQWQPGPVTTIPPSPAAPASPTPAAGAIPDAAGALDVSAYESAHFASPSGRIWCALYAEWTLCHFPRDMDLTEVPAAEEVCPGAELDVTGVSVTSRADFFCSGGAEAMPQTDGDYVGWWRGSGFPSVKYDGQRFAVLPYGERLRRGDFVCLSERTGVTCGNVATGAGFRVARAGAELLP